MTAMIKLSFLELRKFILNKTFIIFIAFVFIILFLLPPYNMILVKTKGVMLSIGPLFMISLFSYVLSSDFENKTYKILFTGAFSRIQVMFCKIIVVLEVGLLFCTLYQLLLILSGFISTNSLYVTISFKDLVNSIIVFEVYAFTLGAFALLITSITLKFSLTFIITYICFNDFISNFILVIAKNINIVFLKSIMNYVPFGVASYGFHRQSYSSIEILFLFSSSIIFFVIAAIIVVKRDLR